MVWRSIGPVELSRGGVSLGRRGLFHEGTHQVRTDPRDDQGFTEGFPEEGEGLHQVLFRSGVGRFHKKRPDPLLGLV